MAEKENLERILNSAKQFELANRNTKKINANIFSILDLERLEYSVHEKMIYSILKCSASEEMKRLFIREFLRNMGLPEAFIVAEWDIYMEYYAGQSGRMDLFFLSDIPRNKLCIVVELKIDAGDQESQLKRYDEYVRNMINPNDYRILYITLDGHQASEQSKKNVCNEKLIDTLSFFRDIRNWLSTCIRICEENQQDTSFIKQYMFLLDKLREVENEENKMDGLLQTKEDMLAAREIEEALCRKREEIQAAFKDRIEEELQKSEFTVVTDSNGDRIVKIVEITQSKYAGAYLGFEVIIDKRLFGYISYFQENNNLIESNEFKNNQKKIASKVENILSSVYHARVQNNKYYMIFYHELKDSHSESYSFDSFSDNAYALIDEKKLGFEAERIAAEIIAKLTEIKRNVLKEL